MEWSRNVIYGGLERPYLMCPVRKDPKERKQLIPGVRDLQASISEQLMRIPPVVEVCPVSSLNSNEAWEAGVERASEIGVKYE